MSFTEAQVENLSSKLKGKHVRTREEAGKVLSYVEGWHTIAEANRIFGFDGWDRETLETRCVWEGPLKGAQACAYLARVRVRVRAGETIVVREGSGAGQGTGLTRGEAHEKAIKEAETDAMKRALSTFGNIFGLALYDKDQVGVRRSRSRSQIPTRRTPIVWGVLGANGDLGSEHSDPASYCSTIRQKLERCHDAEELMDFWARNQGTVAELQRQLPDLKIERGQHYGEILSALYEARLRQLAVPRRTSTEGAEGKTARPTSPDLEQSEPKSGPRESPVATRVDGRAAMAPLEKGPRRLRDRWHLEFVASKNCMVCGRFPSQSHHVRFAQPRALGRKVSDEWVVPLCAIHHRSLHDFGNEEKWWVLQKLDPIGEAKRLWKLSDKDQRAS